MSASLSTLAGAALGFADVGATFASFLRPASIRGVGFWIVASEDATTRRWIAHEFPGRDEPWHEDLGAGPAPLQLEGLLIGADVVSQAERLRRAARAAGPARLVHPWYGSLQVAILACEISFGANEGRVARFRLRLERYGSLPAPGIGGGLIARVLGFVQDVSDRVGEALAEVQAVLVPGDQAIGTIIGIASGLAGAASGGLSASGLAQVLSDTVTGQAIASLAGLTPAEAADLPEVGARADALAAAIAAIPPATAGAPNVPLAALIALSGDPELVALPTDRSTPAAAAEADAAAAIAAASRAALAARAAAAATQATWPAREDALAARDSLAEALDGAADAAAALGWDDTWSALIALRAAASAEISERAAPLPRVRRITLAAPLPAALLAYWLHAEEGLGGVFARAEDIATRNRAAHPGFVSPARPVEVLL
jgi:prophage DNA circulation protein